MLPSDASYAGSTNNTPLSLSLTPGVWNLTATVTIQQSATAGNTDVRFVAGTATLTGITSTTIRAASASQPAGCTLTARVAVTAAGTVTLNVLPVAAITLKAATAANSFAGATSMQAIPLAA